MNKIYDVLDTYPLTAKQINIQLTNLAEEDYEIVCATSRFIILEQPIPKLPAKLRNKKRKIK